jgi:hypothetical protein
VDRTQRLLAGVLALQIVLLVLFNNPFTSHGAGAERPLIPALESITPEKLEIDGEQGASVTLERSEGKWTLAQPAGYPAAAGKVEKLIQDLEHLTAHRQVVSGSRYHAALKVAADDYERRVRIWEKPAKAPTTEVFVGTSPGYQVSHVRVAGSDRVYEASGLNAYDLPADATSWIERNLVSISADEADSVVVANHQGGFTLVKRGGTWVIEAPAARSQAALDQGQASGLVRALCGMTLSQPVGAVDESAQGLASPEATVVVGRQAAGTAAAETVTLRIGGLVPDKQDERYATQSGSGFAVTIPKYAFDRAVTVTLAELLKK